MPSFEDNHFDPFEAGRHAARSGHSFETALANTRKMDDRERRIFEQGWWAGGGEVIRG